MIDSRILACAVLAAALASCGGSPAGQAQSQADTTTKAVYDDDIAAVTQHFDDALKGEVTRSEVGILSDQMHKFGDYQSLTYVSGDPIKNEYTFRANFTNGSMQVVERLDQDGKISAYHVMLPKAAVR